MSQQPSDSRIELHFEKFSSFVEDYASNLSLGGMFLRTRELRPVGSIVDFEIMLADGFQLVRGLGEVIWVLPRETGEWPTGMAVRFQALNDKGRELILRMMEEQVKRGERGFDLEAAPEGALTLRGSGVEPVAAQEATDSANSLAMPAGLSEVLDSGKRILGVDGFTLLDADALAPDRESANGPPPFEELEFDAPWGEQLPEIPVEVLEEDLEREISLPEPEAPFRAPALADPAEDFAVDPEEGSFADLEETLGEDAAADVSAVGEGLVTSVSDVLDDSFFLAEEAAEEIEMPLQQDLLEPELDDIDFDPSPPENERVPDFAADMGEEPTFVMPGLEPVALEEPPEIVEERGAEESPSTFASVEAGPFERETWAPPPIEPPAAATDEPSVPRPAQELPEYEDLFAEEPGSSAGQILKQAFSGSRKLLVPAALLALLLGAGYFLRHSLAAWSGIGMPAVEPLATVVSVEQRPAAAAAPEGQPPVEYPSGAAPPAGSPEVAAQGLETVDPGDSRPPVIQVGVGSETQVTAGSEAASPPGTPAAVAADLVEEYPAPATRVERISWRQAEGGTLVAVELDGGLSDDRFIHAVLEYNAAREMVRIRGIDEPYLSGRVEVGSPEVQQIRTGHHLEPGGNELHIVFDFPDAASRVREVRGLGDRLEILIVR